MTRLSAASSSPPSAGTSCGRASCWRPARAKASWAFGTCTARRRTTSPPRGTAPTRRRGGTQTTRRCAGDAPRGALRGRAARTDFVRSGGRRLVQPSQRSSATRAAAYEAPLTISCTGLPPLARQVGYNNDGVFTSWVAICRDGLEPYQYESGAMVYAWPKFAVFGVSAHAGGLARRGGPAMRGRHRVGRHCLPTAPGDVIG